MNECRRTAQQMTPYVDGSLPAGERTDIDRHLDACAPCRHAVQEATAGRTVLRGGASRLAPARLPPGLRTRCEALAREQVRHRIGWARRFAPAMAVAGLLLVTGLAVVVMSGRVSNTVLAQQLTLDHVKCFRLFEPPDGHTMEAASAERLLAAYGWDMDVPPSSEADGIRLVAARRCLHTGGTMPHVMYRVGDEEISLFYVDGERRSGEEIEAFGHHSRIWSDGDATYVLVSSGDSPAVSQAARYIMQQEMTR